MQINRQLPRLYARGSIFSVTARSLSEDDKLIATALVDQMKDELRADRKKFVFKLSATIGADYKDVVEDGPADVEFTFAIWKASLHLLHHCTYSYKCANCEATSYRNTSGRISKFDQRKPYCPVCGCCEISDPRQSGLKRGAFITYESLMLHVDTLAEDGISPPKTQSCIRLVKGSKKLDNPDTILADPIQRKRFFTKYVWNYFKQMIKENKIQKQFQTTTITGYSDIIAVESLTAYLRKNEIKHSHNTSELPINGCRFIECDLYGLAPRYTPELAEIATMIRGWGVKLEFAFSGIKIYDQLGDSIVVSTEVKSRDYVITETSAAVKDGDKQDDKIESLEDQMNSTAEYERNESLTAIRDALSEDAKKIYDIYMEVGTIYEDFERTYGSAKPRKADIAQFLGVNTKHVNDRIVEIKTHYMRLLPFDE